jgi:hypothetical protein
MMLRERYNTELSLRAENERRDIQVRTFVQPHHTKPEFIGTLIQTISAGTPVAGNRDQHF